MLCPGGEDFYLTDKGTHTQTLDIRSPANPLTTITNTAGTAPCPSSSRPPREGEGRSFPLPNTSVKKNTGPQQYQTPASQSTSSVRDIYAVPISPARPAPRPLAAIAASSRRLNAKTQASRAIERLQKQSKPRGFPASSSWSQTSSPLAVTRSPPLRGLRDRSVAIPSIEKSPSVSPVKMPPVGLGRDICSDRAKSRQPPSAKKKHKIALDTPSRSKSGVAPSEKATCNQHPTPESFQASSRGDVSIEQHSNAWAPD